MTTMIDVDIEKLSCALLNWWDSFLAKNNINSLLTEAERQEDLFGYSLINFHPCDYLVCHGFTRIRLVSFEEHFDQILRATGINKGVSVEILDRVLGLCSLLPWLRQTQKILNESIWHAQEHHLYQN